MNNASDCCVRSGNAAAIFFTVLSSVGALAAAVLPFFLQH